MRLPLAARCMGAALLVLISHGAHALGLLQAYQEALENDPVYWSAVHESEAGRQNFAIGRASLLPTIAINYAQSKNHADIEAPNVFGQVHTTHPDYDSKAGILSLRQPIFNLESMARYRQGAAQANASDAMLISRTQDLMARLVESYVGVKFAEDQLTFSVAQRDAFNEQMRVNRRMFELGEGTRTDMLETLSKFELAEAQVIEAHDNLVRARNILSGMIGRESANLDGLSDSFRLPPLYPVKLSEWKQLALQHNAELVAQRFVVAAAEQEYLKIRAGHAPRLDFVASYNNSKSETISTLQQDATVRSVGIQLNIPLYSGGYVSAAAAQAAANHRKAKSDLQAKTNQLMIELHKQYSLVQSSRSKIDALAKAVESASLLITATQKSIAGGMRINLDLLTAQQQLYSAKRDLAQAKYSYLVASLRLRQAAGRLSYEDLRKVAAYFVEERSAPNYLRLK